jgi:hypothetical protein
MRRLVIAGALGLMLVGGGTAVSVQWASFQWKDLLSYNWPDFVRGWFTKVDREAYKKGKFKGDLVVTFFSAETGDNPPRRVELIQLLKPFGYTDSAGVDWDVPEGAISDGASIPDWFWAMVGGPFSGPYRDAAVIHDHYCLIQTRKWEDVHKVFYEAALNRGTDETLAKTMYAAVLLGGPRWGTPRADFNVADVIRAQVVPTQATTPPSEPQTRSVKTDKEAFEELKAWIEQDKPTMDEIRKRVEQTRRLQQEAK